MTDRVGQQIGNYRLIRLLGQGGFAEVYLGEHVRLRMKAAIKVLHVHLASEEIYAFQQEAQIIADLKHPHIIRVLDFDVQAGMPFLVLDYAPNGSLQQKHPRETRLPLPLVVNYVTQIASALQYAHDRKLIHRDIKPENMLIGEQGEILLSDFGIATIAHSTSSMNTQTSMGTLAYMPPEQIQGKPRKESDLYALAVVVYQWLTGELPFQGSSTEMLAQHLAIPAPPLRNKVSDLPVKLEQVVLKALAKDPKERYEQVQEFAQACADTLKNVQQQTNRSMNQEASTIVPRNSYTPTRSSDFITPMTPQTFPSTREVIPSSIPFSLERASNTQFTKTVLASPHSANTGSSSTPPFGPTLNTPQGSPRKSRNTLIISITIVLVIAALVIGLVAGQQFNRSPGGRSSLSMNASTATPGLASLPITTPIPTATSIPTSIPTRTLQEHLDIQCIDPSCRVALKLDTIVIDPNQQAMIWTFVIRANQDCTNINFKILSLQSPDGIQHAGTSLVGSKWSLLNGQLTRIGTSFNFLPTSGTPYQLLVGTTGDCYNTFDHFELKTFTF